MANAIGWLLNWTTLVLLFQATPLSESKCTSPPAEPFGGLALSDTTENKQSSYEVGQIALFTCKSFGYGYVYMTCTGNDVWSGTNRNCTDTLPVDSGSIAGMVICSLVAILTILFVVVSKPRKTEDNRGEEAKSASASKVTLEGKHRATNNGTTKEHSDTQDATDLPPIRGQPGKKIQDEETVQISNGHSDGHSNGHPDETKVVYTNGGNPEIVA